MVNRYKSLMGWAWVTSFKETVSQKTSRKAYVLKLRQMVELLIYIYML